MPVLVRGQLEVKGTFNRWSTRFLELDEDGQRMRSYANEGGKLLSSYHAGSAVDVADRPKARQNRFDIIEAGSGRTVAFAAPRAEEKARWLAPFSGSLVARGAPARAAPATPAATLAVLQFSSRFGEDKLDRCRVAWNAYSPAGARSRALETLFKLGFGEADLALLGADGDIDINKAKTFDEFLDIVTRATEAAAAAAIARCVRRIRARRVLLCAVQLVQQRLESLSKVLAQGFEVLKFPKKGQPSMRILWMHENGVLCLAKTRTDEVAAKSMRLEDIACVVHGAEAAPFLQSPKYAKLVQGQEACCISVYDSEDSSGLGFHFRLSSAIAVEVLVSKLREIARKLVATPDAGGRRALAVQYATTGKLT